MYNTAAEQAAAETAAAMREEELVVLHSKVNLLRNQVAQHEAGHTATQQRLTELRAAVTAKATELVKDGNACREGTNNWLERNNCMPVKGKYSVTFEVTVCLTADSEDDATEMVESALAMLTANCDGDAEMTDCDHQTTSESDD